MVQHTIGGGTQHANFNNTIFDDSANTLIQNGTAPFFGRFVPQQPLSAFVDAGITAGGTWTLQIDDTKPLNNGTLNSWTLSLTKGVPSTGLGEAVADRSTSTSASRRRTSPIRCRAANGAAVGPAPSTT